MVARRRLIKLIIFSVGSSRITHYKKIFSSKDKMLGLPPWLSLGNILTYSTHMFQVDIVLIVMDESPLDLPV